MSQLMQMIPGMSNLMPAGGNGSHMCPLCTAGSLLFLADRCRKGGRQENQAVYGPVLGIESASSDSWTKC